MRFIKPEPFLADIGKIRRLHPDIVAQTVVFAELRNDIVDGKRHRLARQIFPGVVGLVGVERLRGLFKAHRGKFGIPKERFETRTCLHGSHPAGFGVFFQADIDARILRERNVFQCFYRLVVFHHLHAAHVFLVDVVGGNAITPAQHVFAFDVKLVDGYAVVFDGPAFFHFNAGHFLQHVGKGFVLGVGKAGNHVSDGVAALVDARRFHDDLF
ncbi:hypothetical protein SDC9_92511 [bioreactor metagenome]|uniref:Uncharacterized protein n=1 Tax=bioreactor metagenome TaxID=1076179 RepID=A0A644ZXY0_9ZZZZ